MNVIMIGIISIISMIVILILALGIGLFIARLLKIPVDHSSFFFIAMAVGLGVIAWITFILGVTTRLDIWVFVGLTIITGIITRNETKNIISRIFRKKEWRYLSRHLIAEEKILVVFSSILMGLIILQSITPPWDYDGLMYHLQGPRLFLQTGRIVPLPENWLTFYPFLVEMLFSIGLAFGSDMFARLVNLALAVLLVAATYCAATRFIGSKHAWLAAAILVGIPIFPIWASFAYSDMAWALYEFLGLYVVLIWIEHHQAVVSVSGSESSSPANGWRWLILAGILSGFALGTKYMALGGVGCLGLLVLWKSRKDGWQGVLKNGFIFAITALVIGCPWYVKNLLWTGNPVYPFIFSPGGEIGERVALWLEYMNGFGAPRTLLGYLLLPVLIYTEHHRFGTFLGSIEIPSILFPLAFLYPFTHRTPVLNALAGWTILRFIVWAIGAQQIRFLLPLFPPLSILAAYVMAEFASRIKGVAGRVLIRGLGFGMLAIALIYSLLFFASVRPLGVLLGTESKAEFLRRQLHLYPLQEYIQAELPENARVWMLWDGRGYYCDERCLPDIDQSRWTQVVVHSWDIRQVAIELKERGATHLLMSKQDANFIVQFDRSGLQAKAQDFLVHEFMPSCTQTIISNEYYDLVELICP